MLVGRTPEQARIDRLLGRPAAGRGGALALRVIRGVGVESDAELAFGT